MIIVKFKTPTRITAQYSMFLATLVAVTCDLRELCSTTNKYLTFLLLVFVHQGP